MANNNNKDLLKVGGLWKNTDKNGNDCFSGDFTFGTKMLVFKNTFKKQENEPDFNVFLSPKRKPNKQDTEQKTEPETDDIPF